MTISRFAFDAPVNTNNSFTTVQFDTSSGTLADVSGLAVTLESGKAYAIYACLVCTCPAANGVTFGLSGTATFTKFTISSAIFAQQSIVEGTWNGLPSNLGTNTNSFTNARCEASGAVIVNAGGTIQVQFAQFTPGGTSSIMVPSYIMAIPLN